MTDTIVTNERGGKQSAIEGRPTEFPPLAFLEVSKVMGLGSVRYPREADGTPNWHRIDSMSNLDHALTHVANFLALRNISFTQEVRHAFMRDLREADMLEELSHFAARACMALEMFLLEIPPEAVDAKARKVIP